MENVFMRGGVSGKSAGKPQKWKSIVSHWVMHLEKRIMFSSINSCAFLCLTFVPPSGPQNEKELSRLTGSIPYTSLLLCIPFTWYWWNDAKATKPHEIWYSL